MRQELAYKVSRVLLTFFIAVGFGIGVVQEQIIISLAFLAAGFVILQVLRARYKSVLLSDERTKRINEKAALGTFWAFTVSGALLILTELILDYVGLDIPEFRIFTQLLSYMILALMLVYSVLSFYYLKKM